MGRYSTGVWTVYRAKRLDLIWLVRNGFIKKNCTVSSQIIWTNNYGQETGSIRFESSYSPGVANNCIRLKYTVTKEGKEWEHNHTITLFEQKSNLSKGNILYFICPFTEKKCRILYLAYDSEVFKSRSAYRNRLYYDCQISSKLGKYNDNFWRLDSYLNKLEKQSNEGTRKFKGHLTRAAARYNWLYRKQRLMDEYRWTLGAPKKLRGMIF